MSNGKTLVDPYGAAVAFATEHFLDRPAGYEKSWTLRWRRSEWYEYDAGSYRRLPDDELKAKLVGYLHAEGGSVLPQFVNAVVLSLHHVCLVPGETPLDSWLEDVNGADVVVAANGNISFSDIDAETGKPRLLPHTPLYFTMSKLPYDYDPGAKCPSWDGFIDDVMQHDDEYKRLLRQWCGYLLRRDLREQKFLLMVGEGANGKGVFCEVVESLVGPCNCTHVPLARFGDRFSLYATLGRRVNITNEATQFVEEQGENILKGFVAGDAMTFERKFREPLEAVPTAKVMIACNTLPKFTDKTSGLWRRVLLVPFNRVIAPSMQNRVLAAELKKELPGILNWALEGLVDLNRNGFVIPKAHDHLLEEYRRDGDPARAFLLETYEPSASGEFVSTGEVYSRYKQWCEGHGCKPMNERHFGRHVRRIFPNVERVRRGAKDNREYAYAGLTTSQGAVSHQSHEIPI